MKLKKFVFAIICALLFMGRVNAAPPPMFDFTDDFKDTIEIDVFYNELDFYGENEYDYYILLTDDEELSFSDLYTNVTKYGPTGCEINYDENANAAGNWQKVLDNHTINNSGEWVLLKGYENAFVIRRLKPSVDSSARCEVLKTPIKVSKAEVETDLNSITSIKESTIYSRSLLLIDIEKKPWFYGQFKKNVKIGKIEDQDLIKKLLSQEAGDTDLMEYAKASDGKIVSFDADQNEALLSDFLGLKEDYFFIYTYFDDELYRDGLESIEFAKYKEGEISSENVVYDDENTSITSTTTTTTKLTTKKEEISNPKTGVADYFVLTATILIIGVISLSRLGKRDYLK